MSSLDPTKRTFGVTDPEGLWLLCCDCDEPQNPCDCLNRIAVEFNMLRGVNRSNGVWRVAPVYDLQAYEGTEKFAPSDNDRYYHEPDSNDPNYDPQSPDLTSQIFDNGIWVGPEYVSFYGAEKCTAWNYLNLECDLRDPWAEGTMSYWTATDPIYNKYDIWDRQNNPQGREEWNAGPGGIKQASPMYGFSSGGCVRDPYLGFPYYGSGDNGDSAPECGSDQHIICGTTELKQKATITIGDQTYTTLFGNNSFSLTTQCISPRNGFNPAVNGSYNAGGITAGTNPFPGLPQPMTGGSNQAECPRMNVGVQLFFNCDGTVGWTFQGLQSIDPSDAGAIGSVYRIEFSKNFGQVPGQPVLPTGTWDPDVATSSGQIPVLITRKIVGSSDTYETVYLDWSITQE